MSRLLFRSSFAFLVLALSAQSVSAYMVSYAGPDPNIVRYLEIPDFRRAAVNDRYRYSKRRIEQFDEFTSAEQGQTTFDRRAAYLRASQQRQIQIDVDARTARQERTRPVYLWPEGKDRFEDTARRKLSEAEKKLTGIRLRAQSRAMRRGQRVTPEQAAQDLAKIRSDLQVREANRYGAQASTVEECYDHFARRRLAQCLYEQTREKYGENNRTIEQ